MNRRTIALLSLAAATTAAAGLALLDPIIAAIYDGRGPTILVDILAGRDVHPVTHYQQVAAERFRAPLIALALAGLLAAGAAANTPSTRRRAADLLDGRAGLALTAGGIIVVAGILVTRLSNPPLPDVVLSEVMTSNANHAADEDGDFPDWVELWNTTTRAIPLSEYRLVKNGEDSWGLPDIVLRPDARILVYASSKDRPLWPNTAAFWLESEAASPDERLEVRLGPAEGDSNVPSWVEVINPTDELIDVGGLRVTGHAEELPTVELMPGTTARVDIIADSVPMPRIHAPFRLSRDGVHLELHGPDGIDSVEVPTLLRNVSFGRDPSAPRRWCRFVFPAPGEHNQRGCFSDDRLGAPSFSHGTGVYEDAFDLRIDIPEGTGPVLYTLDGSYPDLDRNPASTLVYDRPIRIEPPPAVTGPLTRIDATITDPIMEWSSLFREAPTVNTNIRPGVALRARTSDSAESVATFLFEPERDDRLPIIALTLEPDHLFHHETGIYVAGATFDRWRSSDSFDPARRWNTPANYRNRTRAWERPFANDLHDAVHLQYCDSDGCQDTLKVGLRIHGNATRIYPQKSLRLYARDDYWNPHFVTDFFGSGESGWRTLILRNGGNSTRSLGPRFHFNDALLQSAMSDLAADTQAFAPVVLYLNGELWGIHNLRERYDPTFITVRYGIDASNVAMLGTGPSAQQPESIVDHWNTLVAASQTLDIDDPASLEFIEDAMDLDSFFDFIIVHTYAGNTDWPGNNSRWWRSIDPSDPAGLGPDDGRWRWMIMDLDRIGNSISGNPDVTHPTLLSRLPPDSSVSHAQLLHGLLRFPEYRRHFFEHYESHLATTFAPDRMVRHLEEFVDRVGPDMREHDRRWLQADPTIGGETSAWEERVEELRLFFAQRPDEVRRHLDQARAQWFPIEGGED